MVAEANKPEWSGGHRGLQTYLQRLLHPTWDSRLVSPTKANPNSLMPNLNEETLKVSRGCKFEASKTVAVVCFVSSHNLNC